MTTNNNTNILSEVNVRRGVYVCSNCKNELFTSEAHFDSQLCVPTCDYAIEGALVMHVVDSGVKGLNKIEIVCSGCGGFIGNVYENATTESGKRYCLYSDQLSFEN